QPIQHHLSPARDPTAPNRVGPLPKSYGKGGIRMEKGEYRGRISPYLGATGGRLVQEAGEASGADRMAQQLEGVVLDLPDPFARDLEDLGDFLERARPAGAEAEAELEDFLLPHRQPLHFLSNLFAEQVEVGRPFGPQHAVVGHEVAERFVA